MEELDYWLLCDELTVVQAALLMAGLDPGDFPDVMQDENKKPKKFPGALAALSQAILKGLLPATITTIHGSDIDGMTDNYINYDTGVPDWEKTTVLIEDLKVWLKSCGVNTGFFFSRLSDIPDYLDPIHANYAPKLAAAIAAWQAVNANPELCKGTTVKQAMIRWLEKNAEQFELIKDDGTYNKKGILETATVSNWDDKPGAPKTPD